MLALHPGGARIPYYGAAFVEQVVARGLDNLHALIVAPDCPTQAWTDPLADRAVLALIDKVRADYKVDSRRARALEKLGRPIRFEALENIGHFEMGGYVESLRRASRWIAERWKQ